MRTWLSWYTKYSLCQKWLLLNFVMETGLPTGTVTFRPSNVSVSSCLGSTAQTEKNTGISYHHTVAITCLRSVWSLQPFESRLVVGSPQACSQPSTWQSAEVYSTLKNSIETSHSSAVTKKTYTFTGSTQLPWHLSRHILRQFGVGPSILEVP